MPIGQVQIYCLLFVCFFVILCVCVCTVMDFFTSGVEFCSAVYQRPMQGITHFGELCSPRSPKLDDSASARFQRPKGSGCERCG